MTGKLFIFIAGSFSSLFWSNLPTILIIWLLITLVSSKYFLLGVIWMASVGHWQCSLQLSLTQISQPIVIQGKVISLLQPNGDSRFNLSVTHIDRQALYFARKMRLSWRQPGWQLAEGQTVRLLAKVKPIHGLANEAGFNYQQWLFSEGIYATGYVKPSETNDLLDDTISVRQQLLDQILAMPLSHKKWLLALSIGYRGLLSTDDWQLVQNTGIAHLIAISGLHLGLVASLSYWVIGWLLGCVISRVNSWHGLNLHKTSLIVTVFTTLGYAAIAGFGLPSVRAWIMLCLFTVVFIRYQYWTWLKVLALAICCFVLVFPLLRSLPLVLYFGAGRSSRRHSLYQPCF
jgi:competence protein ComEC